MSAEDDSYVSSSCVWENLPRIKPRRSLLAGPVLRLRCDAVSQQQCAADESGKAVDSGLLGSLQVELKRMTASA
nr:unnamed protein product [Digitaria exilis]